MTTGSAGDYVDIDISLEVRWRVACGSTRCSRRDGVRFSFDWVLQEQSQASLSSARGLQSHAQELQQLNMIFLWTRF